MKSNKSISRNFFWPISFFGHFKNGQKSIFELGKSLKLPEMQFHEKNDLFDFTRFFFFAWTFLNFLARCAFVQLSFKNRKSKSFFSKLYKMYLLGLWWPFFCILIFCKKQRKIGVFCEQKTKKSKKNSALIFLLIIPQIPNFEKKPKF